MCDSVCVCVTQCVCVCACVYIMQTYMSSPVRLNFHPYVLWLAIGNFLDGPVPLQINTMMITPQILP